MQIQRDLMRAGALLRLYHVVAQPVYWKTGNAQTIPGGSNKNFFWKQIFSLSEQKQSKTKSFFSLSEQKQNKNFSPSEQKQNKILA